MQKFLMIDTRAKSSTSESDTAVKPVHATQPQPQPQQAVGLRSSGRRSRSQSTRISWLDQREEEEETYVDQTAAYDPLHVSFSQAQTHMFSQGGRIKYYKDPTSTDESL